MSSTKTTDQVDVRGPRFVAWITTGVLVITLIVSGVSPLAAAVILGLQAVVFAIGAVGGPRRHPYGLVFANRRGPAAGTGPRAGAGAAAEVRPIGRLGLRSYRRGRVRGRRALVGLVATGAALVAAFLNAAFGICLGCQLYPLVVHLKPAPRTSEPA